MTKMSKSLSLAREVVAYLVEREKEGQCANDEIIQAFTELASTLESCDNAQDIKLFINSNLYDNESPTEKRLAEQLRQFARG